MEKSDDLMKNNVGKSDNIRIFAVGKSDSIMLKRKIDAYSGINVPPVAVSNVPVAAE